MNQNVECKKVLEEMIGSLSYKEDCIIPNPARMKIKALTYLLTLIDKNEELKKEINELANYSRKETPKILQNINTLKSQNKKLEEEVKQWKTCKERYQISLGERTKELWDIQSQLSALREEKVCEHDWKAEWIKEYTTSKDGTKMRCTKCLEVRWIYD